MEDLQGKPLIHATSDRRPARSRLAHASQSKLPILAHAYARCRSNKGAPGVDGQNFADIEAYGVQRWLPEMTPQLFRKSRCQLLQNQFEIDISLGLG